jgi:hypothetical protein
LTQLVDLPLPEVRRGVRAVELLGQLADDERPGRVGQPPELLEVLVELVPRVRPLERDADEQRPLGGRRQ